MKLTFRLKKGLSRQVEVKPEDKLEVLINKLNIGKKSKFVCKGVTYMLCTDITFAEIEAVDGGNYSVTYQAPAGKNII